MFIDLLYDSTHYQKKMYNIFKIFLTIYMANLNAIFRIMNMKFTNSFVPITIQNKYRWMDGWMDGWMDR